MRFLCQLLFVCAVSSVCFSQHVVQEYKLLATNKTSTTEKEMNEASEQGFRFGAVMGGETAFGGSEVVTIMQKPADAPKGRFKYKLLATSKTST
ncbi:MAG: hypothetical protein ABIP81_05675, partial [Terriglobales bacterium]